MRAATRQPEFLAIPITEIDPHPHNPRITFDELDDLAASIEEVGLLQPPVVQAVGDRYQLVAGERRLRAAKASGQKFLTCAVRTFTNQAEAMVAMLVENFQRRELNPMEQARAFTLLCAPAAEGGAGMTQEQAGKRFGRSQSYVANMVRLLKLPEAWQQRVAAGELCEAKVRLIVRHVGDPEFLEHVARDLAESPYAWATVADWERSLAILRDETRTPPPPRAVPTKSPRASSPAAPLATSQEIGAAAKFAAPSAAEPERIITRTITRPAACDADTLCQQIALVESLGELDRIQMAITRQRGRLMRRSTALDGAAATG